MMRDKNLDSGPSVCDTTIAEHVANEAHGSRYGEDWIWHDDRLGYLLTKPSKVKPIPPAGASDAVTDDMVERACAAFYSDLAWRTNSSQSRDFMRSALEAALTGKADGVHVHQWAMDEAHPSVEACQSCPAVRERYATQSAATGAGD